MMKTCAFLSLTLLLCLAAAAQDSSPFPPGITGEFVSRDLGTGKFFRVNPAGCAQQFAPYSSFKIPNSLIGLETGVVKNADEKWHWDSSKYPVPDPTPGGAYAKIWQQDLNLREALANSIVWFYRELAIRVGEPRMQQWLKTFDYGNQNISAGLDKFWLRSDSLRISPDQQVEFLTKLQQGAFPVSKANLAIVKEILTQESTPEFKLIAKTGSSFAGEGWYVGWVERPGQAGCTFALHLKADSYSAMAKVRPQIARELLKQAGCLPR